MLWDFVFVFFANILNFRLIINFVKKGNNKVQYAVSTNFQEQDTSSSKYSKWVDTKHSIKICIQKNKDLL